jgi:excisionase family DNA binding protein
MINAQQIAEEMLTSEEIKRIVADLVRLTFKPEIKSDALYTYQDVALLAGVSYPTIKRAVDAGRLKADYIGSEPRIRGAAILQWLDAGGKTGRSRRDLMAEAGA